MKIIFATLLTLVLVSCSNKKEEKAVISSFLEDDYTIKIDSLIATDSPRIFNGVVLITKNGETKYSKAYGYSNFENKTPLSITDRYRIMSNSKQITAALILKEVEKGNINLQNPVSTYLKDIKQDWSDDVTVHQLLNMSSGIIDIEKPLIFESGKGYRYSNPGYGLLGRILSKVTGKPYDQLANEMFETLGMGNTYCYKIDGPNDGLIDGYDLVDGESTIVDFQQIGITEESWKDFVPAGGVISTAQDLNIWDTKLHAAEILDDEYLKLMTTSSNSGPHAAFDGDTLGYAYGLRVHDDHPVMHLGHGGRGFGFASIKFYVPESKVDVIVWENLYCRDRDVMAGDIVYHFENEIRKIVLNSNLVE